MTQRVRWMTYGALLTCIVIAVGITLPAVISALEDAEPEPIPDGQYCGGTGGGEHSTWNPNHASVSIDTRDPIVAGRNWTVTVTITNNGSESINPGGLEIAVVDTQHNVIRDVEWVVFQPVPANEAVTHLVRMEPIAYRGPQSEVSVMIEDVAIPGVTANVTRPPDSSAEVSDE